MPSLIQAEILLFAYKLREIIDRKPDKPFLYSHEMQTGVIAGTLVMNMKARSNLDCFINSPNLEDRKIVLNLISNIVTADGVKSQVPVIIETADAHSRKWMSVKALNRIEQGSSINPWIETNARKAAYIMLNFYNHDIIKGQTIEIKRYKGILPKLV